MQAYGHQDIINEAKYALLSFLSKHPEENRPKIIIYTDQPDSFKLFNAFVFFRTIDAALIKEWKGKDDFVHRVKIKVLEDFWLNFSQANLLYTDTDIAFLKPVYSIFELIENGKFIMHISEGLIAKKSNLVMEKLHNFLKKNQTTLKEHWRVKAPHALSLYNAGVLGMNNNTLIAPTLALTDAMYALFPKHIVEQFAFSYYAQTLASQLVCANDCIYHYWNFKEFRQVLAVFFEKYNDVDLEELLVLHEKLSPQELIVPKLEYESLGQVAKTFRKITGKRWQMPPFGF